MFIKHLQIIKKIKIFYLLLNRLWIRDMIKIK